MSSVIFDQDNCIGERLGSRGSALGTAALGCLPQKWTPIMGRLTQIVREWLVGVDDFLVVYRLMPLLF